MISPLLKKKAMDALLESMTTDSYESLGAHRRGEPWLPEGKGTEMDSVQDEREKIVIPAKDLAQAPDPANAEFFKESEPVNPIEEIQEHEFFKEAPEFEMSASGVYRITAKGTSVEWDQIQNIVTSLGYKWFGRVSDGTEMWGRKGNQQFIYNPATRTWVHRTDGVADLEGSIDDLEQKITAYDQAPKTSGLGNNRDYKTMDRKVRNALSLHKELMDKYVAEGMTPEEASRKAFDEVKALGNKGVQKRKSLKSCVACDCGECIQHEGKTAGEPWCNGCDHAKKSCTCEGCQCPENKNKHAGDLVSYGFGQPLGGTDNPTGGNDDENADEDQNADLGGMNMTSALAKVATMSSVAWWAKSARPTEQKIQLLQKQLNLTPEQIELCIAADPSPQQKDFVATIAKWFAKKLIQLPGDTANIQQQLEQFMALKKSPKFTGNKDIQQYNPTSLKETVEQNQEAVSKKEQERQNVTKGASIIVQDGDLTIYRTSDVKALMQLSGGTSWCTAHSNHAGFYLKKGPSYVFFKNNSAFAQLHPSSNQLMNRADICMVEEIEDSGDNGKTVARFVSDPTALRGLKLLAQKAPDVKAWVKDNATDPDTLVEILGKKMEEEAGKGTERRDMAVQWAIAKGQPLGPKEEEALPKRVPLNLLMRYGIKFHSGAPWKPLEKAILASKENENVVTDYALEFIKGRWPQGEAKLLQKAFGATRGEQWTMKAAMMRLLDYAVRVVKGRWPELEAKFHTATPTTTNGWGSAQYAIQVLKQAWHDVPGIEPRGADGKINEEVIIQSSPTDYNAYAAKFFPMEMWTKFQDEYEADLGLSPDDFVPEHDLYIVRKWSNLRSCIQSIGAGQADNAMDYALEGVDEPENVDIPADWEMIEEIVTKLSYKAMKRIGESLQGEQPSMVERWAERHGVQQVDWTDPRQLEDILTEFARYAPECSVMQNMREAYRKNAQTDYKQRMVDDLSYELSEGMYERMSYADNNYCELRYGADFGSWNHDWRVGPVYSVLDRDGAVRLMSDEYKKDISDGQLEMWLDEPDMSDNNGDDEEAYELMDRWYTEGTPQQDNPDQMRLQFASALLKKKAAVKEYQADAYIEWGGQYDHRKLTLDEYKGVYEWTDWDASNELDLGKQVGACDSEVAAKDRLEQVVFQIGEPASYIRWEDNTSIKKKDYLKPGEKKFLQDTGINQNIAPDYSDKTPRSKPTEYSEADKLRLKGLGVKGSLLLKKKALIDMHRSPTMLPPRDDLKRRLDEEEQNAIMGDVREGLDHEVSPNTMKPRVQQIDPRINPDGVHASKTADDDAGQDFDHQQDMEGEYFLDQVQDAKNEAKRHFMEEDYIKQLCDDYIPPKTMDQMWKIMGDEYTAEFYGMPYKRVPDFTDSEAPEGWEGQKQMDDAAEGNAARFASTACPLCKTASLKPLDDAAKGYKSRKILAECQNCLGFYSLPSNR